MTPARRQNQPAPPFPPQGVPGAEHGYEGAWPVALRALLLLTDAAHPADATLARLSDEDLAQLRAALGRLTGGEHRGVA